LSEVVDEVLLGPGGHPIGLRLRYSVVYAEGLNDLHYMPSVTVHVREPVGNLVAVKKEVSPPAGGKYRAAVYRFVEDHVPGFLPAAQLFPESRDLCLRWSNDEQRTALLESPPQRFEILIQPYSRRSETANVYTLKTFYEGALQEGAMECRPDPGRPGP
jgi:hypothetical protein